MSAEGLTIVNNLKERVHAVNSMIAISGISDTVSALRTLDKLVDENIVIVETIDLPDGNTGKLYRYNRFRPGLHPKSAIHAVN